MKKKENKSVDDDGNQQSSQPTLCDRTIWNFYKGGVVIAPLLLMLSHWYIFDVFSRNSYELMRYSEENEICIAWIYSILYLYVPLMLLPASFFFKRCFLFQIPFIYFMFINMERWQYGSWFCTNEMIETHKVLIKCIVGLYAFDIFRLLLRNMSDIISFVKLIVAFVYAWLRDKFIKNNEDEL